jgi:hypothetical protein
LLASSECEGERVSFKNAVWVVAVVACVEDEVTAADAGAVDEVHARSVVDNSKRIIVAGINGSATELSEN